MTFKKDFIWVKIQRKIIDLVDFNNIDLFLFFRLFFERKFDLSPQHANTVNSMVYLLSAILSPFFGILIDKTGRNVTWVIISILTTIGSHFILAFTFFNPYVGVVSIIMDVLYTKPFQFLYNSMWIFLERPVYI